VTNAQHKKSIGLMTEAKQMNDSSGHWQFGMSQENNLYFQKIAPNWYHYYVSFTPY
jgi:hypothetical protein